MREVIDATRYYRSEAASNPLPDPAMLGRWWSFLMLAVVVYGLLPRLLSLRVAGALLRSAVARAYVGHPQARTLLDRLATPSVESQGEDISGPQRPDEADSREVVWPPCRAGSVVVNWSEVPVEDSSLLKATGGRSVVRAGGARSLAEDGALLESLAGSSDPAILVVCKAWEPPLLDLQDFLGELRIGDSEAVDVMPVAIESGSPVSARPSDKEVWARAFITSRHRLVSPLVSNS